MTARNPVVQVSGILQDMSSGAGDTVTAALIPVDGTTIINSGGSLQAIAAAPLYSMPTLATFTWQSQGTSTATQTVSGGSILVNLQNAAAWRGLFKAPTNATPYKVRAKVNMFMTESNAATCGLYFSDGTTTNMYGVEFLCGSAGGLVLRAINVGSGSPSNVSYTSSVTTGITSITYQIRNDGTILYFDFSLDGINFFNITSGSISSWTHTPSTIGFGGLSNGGASDRYICWWTNWTEYTNASLN